MERLGPDVERYLRSIVEGLPLSRRSEAQDEFRTHLAEVIQRRLRDGVDQATAEAMQAFGSVTELRRALTAANRHRGDWRRLLSALAQFKLPVDWAAPIKWLRGRPSGNFGRDYNLGRYDAIIERGERELLARGARFNLHHELGMAYSAIGNLEQALAHLEAELDWLENHPRMPLLGRSLALASAYTNLAGVLERLGRLEQAETAVRAGLAADSRPMLLHLQLARFLARRGEMEQALQHVQSAARDKTTHPGNALLVFLSQESAFDALRSDPRFGRAVLQAVAS